MNKINILLTAMHKMVSEPFADVRKKIFESAVEAMDKVPGLADDDYAMRAVLDQLDGNQLSNYNLAKAILRAADAYQWTK